MTIFKTQIKDMGSQASMFKEDNSLIIFGQSAPQELKDFCYIIDVTPLNGQVSVGSTLKFSDQIYRVTAVGSVVNVNLSNLGHVTIKFDGAKEASLPGTLHVEGSEYPELGVGTVIEIL